MKVYEDGSILHTISHNLRYRDDRGVWQTIASDADIEDRLFNKYQLYDYLISPEQGIHFQLMGKMLQDTADEWHDYIIELYKTTLYDYNPIENYDRTEEGGWSDAHHKGTRSQRELNTKDATSSDFTVTASPDITTTDTPAVTQTHNHKEVGYNDTTANLTTVDEVGNTGNNTSHTTGDTTTTTIGSDVSNYTKHSGTDTTTVTDVSDSVFDKDVREFSEYRVHGNIGVMSTQDMIQKQRDIIIDVLDIYLSKFADCFTIDPFIYFNI